MRPGLTAELAVGWKEEAGEREPRLAGLAPVAGGGDGVSRVLLCSRCVAITSHGGLLRPLRENPVAWVFLFYV